MEKVIYADSQNRVSLGSGDFPDGFIRKDLPDGSILLEAQAVISKRELALLKDPVAMESLKKGNEDAKAGRVTTIDVFALEDV